MDILIEPIFSAPFQQLGYCVRRSDSRAAVMFDPGFDTDGFLRHLEEHQLSLSAIVNTHGHADHIAGNRALKDAYPAAPIVIHPLDEIMLRDPHENLSARLEAAVESPPADRLIEEGDPFEAAGIAFRVIHVPGHTPGHVVLLIEGDPPRLIAGDVLFQGSIGRTDFHHGDHNALIHGIKTKLWALPDKTIVYPGHGPTTTIGQEKRTNPFVGEGGVHEGSS